MAVIDDLNRLAAQDVVYLTNNMNAAAGGGAVATEVFRGRLRQALNGNWVFNASTGQNGVVGFDLGGVGGAGSQWNSAESPATGIQVTIDYTVNQSNPPFTTGLMEHVTLTNVIPADFSE